MMSYIEQVNPCTTKHRQIDSGVMETYGKIDCCSYVVFFIGSQGLLSPKQHFNKY